MFDMSRGSEQMYGVELGILQYRGKDSIFPTNAGVAG